MNSPLQIITSLRNTDKYIKTIYTQGGCYQFYLFLASLFPTAEPYINNEENHIISKIGNIFYDINGIYNGTVKDIRLDMIDEIKTWSFSKTMALSLGECPHCEEPILI